MTPEIDYLTLAKFEALSVQTREPDFHKSEAATLIDERWIDAHNTHFSNGASARDTTAIDDSCGRFFLFAANRAVEMLSGDLELTEGQIKDLRTSATRFYQRAQDVDAAPFMRTAKNTIDAAVKYGNALRSMSETAPVATKSDSLAAYQALCEHLKPSYETTLALFEKQAPSLYVN